jgi:thiopeptide-type bacteriocin biosynthesis protein
MLVPLVRDAEPSAPRAKLTLVRETDSTPDRASRPGEDWLFAKLYCGMNAGDRLLGDVVAPLVRELREGGLIARWFFIRYGDPAVHLRLRFQGEPAVLWNDVAPRLFATLAAVRPLVHKVVLDTYDPEVERYGGDEAMEVAHQVFEADSDAALAILAPFRTDAKARWQMTLLGMDFMLADLGLDVVQREAVVTTARDFWARNLGSGTDLSRQLGERYRNVRVELEELLLAPPARYAAGTTALRRRSAVITRAAHQLHEIERRGGLVTPLHDVAASFLHMSANRFFRGSQNRHELVLYDFLGRVYRSARARAQQRSHASRASGVQGDAR